MQSSRRVPDPFNGVKEAFRIYAEASRGEGMLKTFARALSSYVGPGCYGYTDLAVRFDMEAQLLTAAARLAWAAAKEACEPDAS